MDPIQEEIDRLTETVRLHKARIADSNLMGTINAQLLGSRTCQEAYRLLGLHGPSLFPDLSGALYMQQEADCSTFERVAVFGPIKKVKRTFHRQDCRAVCFMKAHHVDRTQSNGLLCTHARIPEDHGCVCLPLLTEGIALGVIHVQGPAAALTPWKLKLADELAAFLAMLLRNLRLREMLSEQAIRDPLTRLNNRRYMDDWLKRELCVREKRPIALIMMDIDHFKNYNSLHLHEGADAMLRAFGAFLQQQIRPGDVAVRRGGEEFILLMRGANLKTARQRAEKIRREVKLLRVTHLNQPLSPITLSLGVDVVCPGTEPETALHGVDWAVREAKRKGRDRVVVARRSRSTNSAC